MGSLYISDTPRQGEYKESVGLDIDGGIIGTPGSAPDGLNYYDYDLLNRPTFDRVGTNILIDPTDNGFPDKNDYKKVAEPDGSIRFYKKDLLRSGPSNLDTMLENVNNGRLGDVSVVKDMVGNKQGDMVIKKDNNETAIKGILEQNSINDIFFSDMNMKVLQDTIRYKVHEITKKVISEQSQNELYIIMRSIMLQFANFRVNVDNIVDEIKRLNEKVVEYSVENISSNVLQHDGYIKDLSKLPTPMDRPLVSNSTKNFTYDISNLL